MKTPVRLLEEYNGYSQDEIIVVESEKVLNHLLDNSIATELSDDELDDFLSEVDEDLYEELITNLKGEL